MSSLAERERERERARERERERERKKKNNRLEPYFVYPQLPSKRSQILPSTSLMEGAFGTVVRNASKEHSAMDSLAKREWKGNVMFAREPFDPIP